MIVSTSRFFPLANLTEYLMSTIDGTMPLKELNSAEVRLLSTRFYALAIITSFALTSGPSEVLSVLESHTLHDSNSLLAFERNLEEIHVTGAHLEKKRTRLQTYTNISQEFYSKAGDDVTDYT
ncbi:hypothetical protein Tco_1283954 [Tanacetum coccineum]